MERADLKELHYILPLANIVSVALRGILCHKLAERLDHESIAMEEMQDRRRNKRILGGSRLHDYANLYFNARNKMLFKRSDQHEHICILRVSTDVLDIPNVVVTDQNAASDYVRFYTVDEGLAVIDAEKLFAEYWTHPGNEIEEYRHGSLMCAEVLVPNAVPREFIMGAYVCSNRAKEIAEAKGVNIPFKVNKRVFFR